MPRSERRELRVATSAIYFQLGVVLAVWAVCIPQVRAELKISASVLGSILLTLGAGLLTGIQVGGPILDRLGSRRICGIGIGVFATAINIPGFGGGPAVLVIALFGLGLGCGLIDISVTDQAVRVERAYGRSVMASIHAFYSIGATLGAGLGAGLQSVGAGLRIELLSAAVISLATGLFAVPRLQDDPWERAESEGQVAEDPLSAREPDRVQAHTPGMTIVVLAVLAAVFMLAEGVASDWGALESIDRYGIAKPSAALALVAFTTSMTVGRLTIDQVVRRVGPAVVLRAGGSLAATALVLVVFAPTFWVAVLGWGVFGLAIAGLLPQIFSALGGVSSDNRGRTISHVVGAGYVGLLSGPGVIGWLSHFVSLRYALVLPAGLCVASVTLAGRATGRVPGRAAARGQLAPTDQSSSTTAPRN
ncbi:MFS transporter [Jatrophihabitans sp.]|uniref:MFS transporter n=1 Tax=Jatrophihabitans sp. TaxID=1932789 RepID=UPI0030C6C929|nr:putative major facilitator superfamily transporter [Jatrophihabitans sp.]